MAWSWWSEFDDRFRGKWKSEEITINTSKETVFLNIEFNDQSGTNVFFSFGKAFFNNSAFYVESSYNSLYFFHNDREHRAEYILTLESDDLIKCKFSVKNCWGLQGSFEKDVEFKRLSEEDVKKYQYTVEPRNLTKIELLREYSEYCKENSDVKFEYKFDERENMLDIIKKYQLDNLVKDKSDVETAIALMNWLCGRYRHGNPPGGLANVRTPGELMKFADENNGVTNCRGLSLILAQLIRAYNIKAFHLTCMPYEEPFDDCHVVVCVYCESLKKWIMLDPTNRLYLKNSNGEIIGVSELRDILITGKELSANSEANYHGKEFNLDWYSDYMAKNMIRLVRGRIERYGSDWNDGSVRLIPEKYMQNEVKKFDANYKNDCISSEKAFWQV